MVLSNVTDPGSFSQTTTESHEAVKLIVGIIVALVAATLSSFGIALQRKSHTSLPGNAGLWQAYAIGRFASRHLWKVGFIIYLLSAITGSIFSIGSLPVTLLAPLGAYNLICNAVFARVLLNDPWSWHSGIGTFIILIGAGIVGGFGSLPDADRSLDDLLVLYGRLEFILYFSIQEVLLLAALAWNTVNAIRINRAMEGTGLGRGWRNNLPFSSLSPDGNRTVVGLVYGAISILISTQGILFTKSGIELLSLTIGGQNQFDRSLAWIVIFLLVTTATAQLYYLNRAVEYCDIVILMPANYCVYNVSCLLNGLVYYNQWGLLSWWKLLLVALGSVLLSIGVIILSLRPQGHVALKSSAGSEAEFAFLAGEVTPPRSSTSGETYAQHLSSLQIERSDEESPLLNHKPIISKPSTPASAPSSPTLIPRPGSPSFSL